MNIERKRELKILATEIVANMAAQADTATLKQETEDLSKREADYLVSQVHHIGVTLRNRVARMKDAS